MWPSASGWSRSSASQNGRWRERAVEAWAVARCREGRVQGTRQLPCAGYDEGGRPSTDQDAVLSGVGGNGEGSDVCRAALSAGSLCEGILISKAKVQRHRTIDPITKRASGRDEVERRSVRRARKRVSENVRGRRADGQTGRIFFFFLPSFLGFFLFSRRRRGGSGW